MSLRAIAWVFNEAGTRDPIEVLVLLAIADHYNDETAVAYPSIALLAKKTRLTERALYKVLARLKAGSLVVVEPGKGRRASNHYRLVMQIGVVTPEPRTGVEPLNRVQVTPEPRTGGPLNHGQGTPEPRSDEPLLNRNLNPQGTGGGQLRHQFEELRDAFPKKGGGEEAFTVYQQLAPDAGLHARMIAVVRERATSPEWTRARGHYVPRLRRWLEDREWELVTTNTPGGAVVPDAAQTTAMLEEMRRWS